MRTQDILANKLTELDDSYPDAAAFAEDCRQDQGKSLPSWPAWCYAPMAAWYAAACGDWRVRVIKSAKCGLSGSRRYS